MLLGTPATHSNLHCQKPASRVKPVKTRISWTKKPRSQVTPRKERSRELKSRHKERNHIRKRETLSMSF
jgi:hypothetical protein